MWEVISPSHFSACPLISCRLSAHPPSMSLLLSFLSCVQWSIKWIALPTPATPSLSYPSVTPILWNPNPKPTPQTSFLESVTKFISILEETQPHNHTNMWIRVTVNSSFLSIYSSQSFWVSSLLHVALRPLAIATDVLTPWFMMLTVASGRQLLHSPLKSVDYLQPYSWFSPSTHSS